ncbi:liprin-alpha-1 [Phthorimaea operculella]|nr:liprin-alpha-1 [Phthorimaea operculella]
MHGGGACAWLGTPCARKNGAVCTCRVHTALLSEFATLTKELNQAREQLLEREEEISELKAERNNTRLLLEHLECLVSRHERSLRMTVVKRQAAAQSGVSSEVEVLKALKSLFEHHKALDEKVRERLRVALERNTALEEELALTKEELQQYKSSGGQDGDKPKENGTAQTGSPENGEQQQTKEPNSVNGESESSKKLTEYQNTIAKQSAELSSWQRRVAELNNKVSDLEERLQRGEKELAKKQEECAKLQRDLRENVAQKEDQEERIATLEKRYLSAQRESTSLHDLNEKLDQELQHKQAQLKLHEEKIAALEEKLELSTQKLSQMSSLPEMEEQLKARLEALNQAQERHGSAEDRIQRLEASVEEKNAELMRLNQRLRMNEEHNTRLSATVDKLLSESNDRLQVHLKERMHALDEKNALTQELEKTRKYAEELMAEKQDILKELAKWRMETEQLKRQMLQQEIAFNIQQTDALTRSLSPGAPQQPPPQQLAFMQSKLDGSWEKLQQAHHLANVQQAFDTSDAENDESDGGVEGGHTDAAALALMLQEQLDAINTEIRLIQEEKQTTEARAEELESRQVGSYEHMNLLSRRGESPPLPASPSRPHLPPHHKYHTAPAAMSPAHQFRQAGAPPPPACDSLPASQLQLCEDNSGGGSGSGGEGAESPLTARSLRLERAARALHAERDRLRTHYPQPYDSSSQESLGGLASGPSWGGGASPGLPRGVAAAASAVSIASMHQQKKRGIKSSLGRLFSKKEKGGMPMQGGQAGRSLSSTSSLGLSSLADDSASHDALTPQHHSMHQDYARGKSKQKPDLSASAMAVASQGTSKVTAVTEMICTEDEDLIRIIEDEDSITQDI